MHFVIDFILLAVIVISCIWYAKKGFVRTFIEVVGLVAAVIIAFTVSGPLANTTYDELIEPPIIEAAAQSSEQSVSETADKIWEKIPLFLSSSISKEGLEESLADAAVNSAENAMQSVSRSFIKPVAIRVLEAVFTLVLMIPLMLIVRLLARLINKAFSFSFVGKLNKFLGGVTGFIKGTAIALLLCEIIVLIISFTENGIWIFNSGNIDKTYIFKFLTNVF